MVLDSRAEEMFRRSLREISSGTGGALDPEHARILGENLEAAAERMETNGRRPCVITSPDLRRYVRAFVERRRPHVGVLSFREIEADVTVQPAETVSIAPPAAA
jgi:flagellar biosynthesis protein FlhA